MIAARPHDVKQTSVAVHIIIHMRASKIGSVRWFRAITVSFGNDMETYMMTRRKQALGLMALSLLSLAGCATKTGFAQSPEEFVTKYKRGGLFRSAEHIVVDRPAKKVIADVTDYANTCLNLRVTTGPSNQYSASGSTTTYLPKIETIKGGATTFSLQEIYNDQPQSGQPPGGMFTLVAEIRADGSSKTKLDIYYASKGKIAEQLKLWSKGDKSACPSFD